MAVLNPREPVLFLQAWRIQRLQLQRDHNQMKDGSTVFYAEFMYQHATYLLIQRYKQWTYRRQQIRSREIAWTLLALLLHSAP
jgi:hypothetical protein